MKTSFTDGTDVDARGFLLPQSYENRVSTPVASARLSVSIFMSIQGIDDERERKDVREKDEACRVDRDVGPVDP